MNQTFQFRRFGLLLRLYLEENGRWYLTKLAICFVICAAFLSVWASVKYYETFFSSFAVILIGISGVDSTTTLSNYNKKNCKGMRFLLLPASASEKVIASLIINILFCSLNIFLLFTVVKLMNYFSLEFSDFNTDKLGYIGPLFSYFLIISLLVLGSIYFIKYYVIKLLLSLYLLSKLFSYYDKLFFKLLQDVPDFAGYRLFYSWTIRRNRINNEMVSFFDEYRVDHVYLIDSCPNLVPIIFGFILIAAIWYASFLRLRETEI